MYVSIFAQHWLSMIHLLTSINGHGENHHLVFKLVLEHHIVKLLKKSTLTVFLSKGKRKTVKMEFCVTIYLTLFFTHQTQKECWNPSTLGKDSYVCVFLWKLGFELHLNQNWKTETSFFTMPIAMVDPAEGYLFPVQVWMQFPAPKRPFTGCLSLSRMRALSINKRVFGFETHKTAMKFF